MTKKFLLILSFWFWFSNAYAFEDCLVTSDGKLSDISIENNQIIDVYPIFTVMNEKNTLYVHPLKEGKTRFCILKNGKDIVMFNVEVQNEQTIIDDVKGFEILGIDVPPENNNTFDSDDLELDLPPMEVNHG